MFKQNTNVVIDSEIKTFVFKLENGKITYNILDSSLNLLNTETLQDEEIKLFSASIDLQDTIHLVALIDTGDLNYYKYIDDTWLKSTISNFDVKSNIYNQIEILIVDNKLHIIYNYSNLMNSNIWSLQHVIYDGRNGSGRNIIRYLSKRSSSHFTLDLDNHGTIHLFYSNDLSGTSRVHHTFYNLYTKAWVPEPPKLSLDNIHNLVPFLFIDLANNLHCISLEEVKGGYKIKYLRMSSTGKEKHKWKEIKLTPILVSSFPPIIFQEDNKLKLLYISQKNMKYIVSTDYGISWSLENTLDNMGDDISVVKVSSNLSSKNHKINHSCFNNSYSPKLNGLEIYSDNTSPPEEIKTEDITMELIEEDKEIDRDLLVEINNKIDQLLDNYNIVESFISTITSKQIKTEELLSDIQKSLDENNKSFFSKLFN